MPHPTWQEYRKRQGDPIDTFYPFPKRRRTSNEDISSVGSFDPSNYFDMPGSVISQSTVGTTSSRRSRMRPAKKGMAYKGKPKITPNLRRAIKQVVNSQAETKRLQYGGSLNVSQFNTATTQVQISARTLQIVPQGTTLVGVSHAYPEIREGAGQDQRVGDKIMIKGQYLRYTIVPNLYNATTNPLPRASFVQIWLVQPTTGMNLELTRDSIISGSTTADFFEAQTDSTSGMAGNFLDFHYGIDRQNYKVLATRRHKLGFAETLGTANQPLISPNNDFSQLVQGQIKIPGYSLFWDRQNQAQKQPIYMIVQIVAADQQAYAANHVPATMYFNLDTFYTDM